MSENYDPQIIEAKWQRRWEESRLYQTDLDAGAIRQRDAAGIAVGNLIE